MTIKICTYSHSGVISCPHFLVSGKYILQVDGFSFYSDRNKLIKAIVDNKKQLLIEPLIRHQELEAKDCYVVLEVEQIGNLLNLHKTHPELFI